MPVSLLMMCQGLQLLEFLIKNGSERVIDDARGHLSLLKMLRQFQFIDQNGKDQGVNVRNRAKELAELLSDVDRIRAERKKARSNRNKFGGVEGGGGMSGGASSGSRYGGFGSEEAGYGGYSGGTYGDGGGFGGNTSSGFQDSSRKDRFEEYDEFDEGVSSPSSSRRKSESSSKLPAQREAKKPEEPKKEPEDLFSFGDDDIPPAIPPKPSNSNGKQTTSNSGNNGTEDDDFDDFISATPSATTTTSSNLPLPQPAVTSFAPNTQFAAPKPVSASQGVNLNDLVGFSTPSPAQSTATSMSAFSPPPASTPYTQQIQPQAPRPTGYQASQPNYFTSIPAPSPSAFITSQKPTLTSDTSFNRNTTSTKPSSSSSNNAFGSLWSTASANAGIKKTPTPGSQGPNLASMAKEKSSLGIWGAPSTASSPQQGYTAAQSQGIGSSGTKVGGGLDDLLG